MGDWKGLSHDKWTAKFAKDVKSEKTLQQKRIGEFQYIFTNRFANDDFFYGAVTAFHIPSKKYAGDLLVAKWNGESDKFLEASVQVHPEFRRKGVASNMYDFAERVIGKRFKPAPSNTRTAKMFWKKRKKL